jgi:hypothetical protein
MKRLPQSAFTFIKLLGIVSLRGSAYGIFSTGFRSRLLVKDLGTG